MKKIALALLAAVVVSIFASCRDNETYAEKRDRERSAINKYLNDSTVKTISEEQFAANGYKTDLKKNEFVLFASTGVYMQIVRNGCGERLKNGETANVLCRYTERNLLTDSLISSNDLLYYSSIPDKMIVTNTSGTFQASFVKGQSVMASIYGSTSVPTGWLVPFTYIQLGRPSKDGDEIAKVRLIVPSTSGQESASRSTYPCLYDITFERSR